ncbi:MAG: GxxExxY protein [Bacteroidales bacterium]
MFDVYNNLGQCFAIKVYHQARYRELTSQGYRVSSQKSI